MGDYSKFREQRRKAYEKYKEQQKNLRALLNAKKEQEKLHAREEKYQALRSMVLRGSELSPADDQAETAHGATAFTCSEEQAS
jgi:hypothetical protein